MELRELLISVGYLESGIDLVVAAGEDGTASALHALLRLFRLSEDSLTVEEASAALYPLTIEQLVRAGFLRCEGNTVVSTVIILACHHLLVALPRETDEENAVMPIGGSSLELDNFTVRRRSSRTLDLGTGCGIQAMRAASHSEVVVAVDLNATAIRFAEFNCRWNDISNVMFLQGSFVEPVRNQLFDLIVANPPFVISPKSRLMYRDSGSDGDQMCIRLARDAAQLLNEDGYFQMVFQWVEPVGIDWKQRLSACFSGLNCDVWILRAERECPDAYVRAWMQQYEDGEGGQLYSEWMQYFANLNADSIGGGFCIMKRVAGRRPSISFDEAPEDRSEPYGDDVAIILSAREYIDGCSDPVLLQQKLVPSPHLCLFEQSRCNGQIWQPTASELALDHGLKYSYSDVDAILASIPSACNGQRTLKDVLELLAARNNIPTDRLVSKYLSQVRELVRYAFLLPCAFASKPATPKISGEP